MVAEQQRRSAQFRQEQDEQRQRGLEEHRAEQLQQQRRTAQYRFQEDYSRRERQEQLRFQNERNRDYDRDPYYYSAPVYRYRRGGNYREINQYGADVLRQAVNYGYGEGFRTGQADREDRWHSDYQDSYAYQDANYGYNGYYVDRDDYNYYFREGFRRGYDDGYNSRYEFGRPAGNTNVILDFQLSNILGFVSIR
jgi:hypothetical protein